MPEVDFETVMVYRFGEDAHGVRIPAGSFNDWLQTTIRNGYFVEGARDKFVVPWHSVSSIQRHWSG